MKASMRRTREKSLCKAMMVFTALVLILGIAFVVSMKIKMRAQEKEIASVESQIQSLNADILNLQLCIDQSYDIDAIEKRAEALGMEQMDESRVRVVTLYTPSDSAVQSAMATGDEN